MEVQFRMGFDISIHAPAKGATIHRGLSVPQMANFNPRSREGSDLCRCIQYYRR